MQACVFAIIQVEAEMRKLAAVYELYSSHAEAVAGWSRQLWAELDVVSMIAGVEETGQKLRIARAQLAGLPVFEVCSSLAALHSVSCLRLFPDRTLLAAVLMPSNSAHCDGLLQALERVVASFASSLPLMKDLKSDALRCARRRRPGPLVHAYFF